MTIPTRTNTNSQTKDATILFLVLLVVLCFIAQLLWDFSEAGRIRQSNRMKNLANFEKSYSRLVVCDFVCPTEETRQTFEADFTVWMDTIKKGKMKAQINYLLPPLLFKRV